MTKIFDATPFAAYPLLIPHALVVLARSSAPHTPFAPSPIFVPSSSRCIHARTPLAPLAPSSCHLAGFAPVSHPHRALFIAHFSLRHADGTARLRISHAVAFLILFRPVLTPVCPPVAPLCHSPTHHAPRASVAPVARPSRRSRHCACRRLCAVAASVPLSAVVPVARLSRRSRLCAVALSCLSPSSRPSRPSPASHPTRVCRARRLPVTLPAPSCLSPPSRHHDLHAPLGRRTAIAPVACLSRRSRRRAHRAVVKTGAKMTREPPKSPTGPGMRVIEADESADEVKDAVQLSEAVYM
ncbi:hypothetical protein DENSPDRAFT_886811 [Dentipellis sp. KUC8613]|nr:hypothetical protein DENSPDRAFT_886811 [Dentipellis sp. KUC8613]